MELDNAKQLIYPSAQGLTKQQQISIPSCNGTDGLGPFASFNPYNVKRLQVKDSPNTHIGPKFIASNLTIQLPSDQKELNQGFISRRWLVATVGSAALLLSTCMTVVFIIPPPAKHNFPDDGNIPSDWYYDRELMNMSTCPESEMKVTAELIVVDSIEIDCNDVYTCADVIRNLPEVSHFYLKNGRIFEGLGWNCGSTKHLKTVFFSKELSQSEMYSFNMLLHLGKVIKIIANRCEILPMCCVGESVGPSKSVMNFLKTLVNFRNRDCVVKHTNCQ